MYFIVIMYRLPWYLITSYVYPLITFFKQTPVNVQFFPQHDDRHFAGYGVDSTDKKDILYGPTFTVNPTDVTMISKTTSLFVECRASSNPPAAYKWYRGPQSNQTLVRTTTFHWFSLQVNSLRHSVVLGPRHDRNVNVSEIFICLSLSYIMYKCIILSCFKYLLT